MKGLQSLEGLALFPLFALVCAVGLFPAYGFRPECIPLVIIAILLNIHTIPEIAALVKRESRDAFLYAHPAYALVLLGAAVLTAGTAVIFAPLLDAPLRTEGVSTVRVTHTARNAEFFLRIYGQETESEKRPLLFVVPPVIGSVTAVDLVCTALEAQGFKVITYSRRNFDVPAVGHQGKRYGVSPGTLFRLFRAFALGTAFEDANSLGRTLEGERTEDMLFLLAYIRDVLDLGRFTDKSTVFLAGYDLGGSGSLFIGESSELIKDNPQLKGVIVIESPLWSLYQAEQRRPPAPPEGSVLWFRNMWSGITGWFLGLAPKKMIGVEQVPRLKLPALFLVSDKAAIPRYRDGPYRPIIRMLQSSQSAIAAVNGAGVLAYSDYPVKYPLYGAFFPGSKPRVWEPAEYIEGTAAIIGAFASLAVSGSSEDAPKSPLVKEEQKRFLEKIHFESGRVWNLPSFKSILMP
jgi:hypothetical protein